MADHETPEALLARIDERTIHIHDKVNDLHKSVHKRLDDHELQIRNLNRFKYYVHGIWAAIAGVIGYLR